MRVLQLTRQFLPAQGGIETLVQGLSLALRLRGHQVQVATLRCDFATGAMAPAHSIEAGLPVTRMRHWGPRRYPVAPSALRTIQGFDLVHIHAIDFFVDYLSLLRVLHRIPLIVSTHGGFFHTQWGRRFKDMYFKTITRASLAGVQAVVCVSQHDRELFARIVTPKRLRVIENGVHLEPFWALHKVIEPGLMVGIARLDENKRIHLVLEAMAALKHRFPHLHLAWIGADHAGLLPALERRVVELGLSGRVRFHGKTSREDLLQLLQRAHLFVSASRYEGFGLATIEAMAAATAVVVTDVGAHAEVVQNGVTGFLVPQGAQGLATHLGRALSLPVDQLQTMGEAARAATARFSWMQVAPRYEQLYREVIAREPVTRVHTV